MSTQTQDSGGARPALKGVDSARLEKELTKLWAEATPAPEGGGKAAGLVRACVLNLIVYSTEEERGTVDPLLDEVFERNPARVLLIVARRGEGEEKLNAFVSSRCRLKGGGKQVCGEQVTLEVGGRIVDTAATAVSPLLVPDVPVFLWWKDIPHYEDRLFNQLVELADREVIDSASFDHPHEDLMRLAWLLRERSGQFRLSDINWGRLTSWRSLVASFWDVADYRPYLDRIGRVRIEYNEPAGTRGEIAPKALLAVGWLASRLGWEAGGGWSEVNEQGARFSLSARGPDITAVEVQLEATGAREGAEGMLTKLSLSSGDADFYVELRPDGTKLETGARIGEGERTVGRVLGYEARSEGQRLSGELDILSRDLVYEQAVEYAARMLESIKK